MKYRLVVFDWDGTIADSTSLIAECIQLAAIDCGLNPPTTEEATHIIGLGILDSTQQLFPALDHAGLQQFADRYRAHYVPRDHELRLFEGIDAVLNNLTHKERFLAVATGKPRRGLERAFETFADRSLRQHFHFTRCADEGHPKPHPDMLHKLMSFTGVSPEETLMIGDTTHDLNMAANAGCDGLGVAYGAHQPEKLKASPNRGIMHSVAALDSWLQINA